MKRYGLTFIRCTLIILAIGLLSFLSSPKVTQAATTVPILIDQFSGTSLDSTKWVVRSGSRSVANGKLTLAGGVNTRAEVQSRKKFSYAVLQLAITSSNWKAQNETTDSSFGFEIWQGANGQCHYGVILIANGHLGLLKSQPDATGNCSGDPIFQDYRAISNWNVIRAGGTLRLTFTWAPMSVTLHVSSGITDEGIAFYLGGAEPTNWLRVRLNADQGETYSIDYVRAVGIPWR